MSGYQANKLQFGFFNGEKQWLHISKLSIINSNGEDIMKNTGTTVTSTSKYFQEVGDLKGILNDDDPNTFSHSLEEVNPNITVTFDKPHTVVQIIVNNRPTSSLRIIGTQIKLFMDDKQPAYTSEKITIDKPYYYVFPPNITINTSDNAPPITTPAPTTTTAPTPVQPEPPAPTTTTAPTPVQPEPPAPQTPPAPEVSTHIIGMDVIGWIIGAVIVIIIIILLVLYNKQIKQIFNSLFK
jgi:hypothetical protein